MKISIPTLFLSIIFVLLFGQINAQDQIIASDKKYVATIGLGYFAPLLTDNGITFEKASFDPEIGFGFSYFASLDYSVSEQFSLGLGFNGNYAGAKFIKDAMVNGETVAGHLEAGAVANAHWLLNFKYTRAGDGIQPYAKLGLGYFIEQVELGDVPLELTDNVETELFPDYKSSGFGILPELGIQREAFSLSVAYSFPLDDLTGETVPGGYLSVGTISSHGLQVNVGYSFPLF